MCPYLPCMALVERSAEFLQFLPVSALCVSLCVLCALYLSYMRCICPVYVHLSCAPCNARICPCNAFYCPSVCLCACAVYSALQGACCALCGLLCASCCPSCLVWLALVRFCRDPVGIFGFFMTYEKRFLLRFLLRFLSASGRLSRQRGGRGSWELDGANELPSEIPQKQKRPSCPISPKQKAPLSVGPFACPGIPKTKRLCLSVHHFQKQKRPFTCPSIPKTKKTYLQTFYFITIKILPTKFCLFF